MCVCVALPPVGPASGVRGPAPAHAAPAALKRARVARELPVTSSGEIVVLDSDSDDDEVKVVGSVAAPLSLAAPEVSRLLEAFSHIPKERVLAVVSSSSSYDEAGARLLSGE